jgi:phospholipase C
MRPPHACFAVICASALAMSVSSCQKQPASSAAAPAAPGVPAVSVGAARLPAPIPAPDPVSAAAPSPTTAPLAGVAAPAGISRINHLIVIYQENWSFDGLYSQFKGANGVAAESEVVQRDDQGRELPQLPQPVDASGAPDGRFPSALPVHFYNLLKYVPPHQLTGDLIHAFFTEQAQIHGGANDAFCWYSSNPGLVTGFYDASLLPEGQLAADYVMCDNCFHSAFGGSFLNHQFLISAAVPAWPSDDPAPVAWRSVESSDRRLLRDRPLTPDGRWIVNTVQTCNLPHGRGVVIPALFANPTIGDRLSAAHVSWAWYAGGWNTALATGATYSEPDDFQPHHQPFNYYAAFDQATAAGQANRKLHLQDETDFLAALAGDASELPAVCFIKPAGCDNEHPGYSVLARGQRHVADLVAAVQQSPSWKDCMIVITYDEHGGRWDHVAPPVIDRWGPGVRVPMIVVSPFAKRQVVDHTRYETVSILRFIEDRWHLSALGTRDAQADGLSQVLAP